MMNSDKRRFERYPSGEKAGPDFQYVIDAQLDILSPCAPAVNLRNEKYHAQVRNISVEGMCICCDHRLREGENLDLELYLRGNRRPVHMQGQVRWTQSSPQNVDKEKAGFEAGIKLLTIEGATVHDSVYFDENYQVYWSKVLDVLTGIQKNNVPRKNP